MKVLYLCLLVFLLPYVSVSQLNYNFFISNSGSDTNSGVSQRLPKRTIAATKQQINTFGSLSGKVSVGLQSGSEFNESLILTYPIQIGTYRDSLQKNDFALLTGSEAFDSGWDKMTGTSNTYKLDIASSGFTGNGAMGIGFYSFIYVTEIDKELEKTAPFTARKILQFASGMNAVDLIPGSFYEANSNVNPTTIFVHTSDNNSPNAHSKYRYEVTVKAIAVGSYNIKNNRFENLWLRGYGAGIGAIPSGANAYYNKVIFGPGSGIHHVVLRNGTINHSLFLPGPKNIRNLAAVFYDVEGFNRHNKISNSIFLDIESPIYTHISYGSNHGCLELDNVIAFADKTQGGNFVSASNTDTLLLNNVYTDGFTYGYNYVSTKYVSIKNSYFKDATTGIVFGEYDNFPVAENIFIKTEGNNTLGILMKRFTKLELSNSLIHISSKKGVFIQGSGRVDNHISATGNIFIGDVDSTQSVIAAVTNTNNGKGTSLDRWSNNVYILLKGSKILWSVTNAATNNGNNTIQTFEEWKKQSGQDQNSLFFDLRNDKRGLQAIFIDPDNGNYQLANTVEGNQIKALHAGMTTPIACFLKKPTYEEAADLIKNDKVLSINSCRYSCQQATVHLGSSTPTNSNGLIGICPNQDQVFKGSGSYEENDKYYHQSDATSRYLWWFSDGSDTSGTGLRSITHKFEKTTPAHIRLQIVDENGCSFDSAFAGIEQSLPIVKLGADAAICSGFDVTLSVAYQGAGYLWSNGSTNNTITVKNKGVYWVQTILNGCSFKDSIELKLQECPCTVQMPNAFSPNNDGLNDLYKPVLGCVPTTFNLSVYNKFGQSVFMTKDYKNYWNGTVNGKPLPAGAYVYVLKTNSETLQKIQQLHGSIILIR
ncbi:MAG: gliding motility-associated C-terminal domain-containing protein [Ginsengibacter sp.]